MIKKLEHYRIEVAHIIRSLFQVSYAVEAELLNAVDFPPLKRPLTGFVESENTFYGYFKSRKLAGAVEVDNSGPGTHIQSLVVHPDYFRQGIGSALVAVVLETYDSPIFTVETGLENNPATDLYRRFGFQQCGQYKTDHGVRKVRFKKRIN